MVAVVDLLAPRQVGAVRRIEAGRAWLAARTGLSTAAFDRAWAALARAHQDAAGPVPAYVGTRQRGRGRTAERFLLADVLPIGGGDSARYVDAPAWTLGDAAGPLVAPAHWRAYVVLLDDARAHRARWSALGRRQLALRLRVRSDDVAAVLAELEAAGLVVVARRRGRADVVRPLVAPATAEERAALAAALAVECGYAPQAGGPPDAKAGGPPDAKAGGPPDAKAIRDTLQGTPFKGHKPSPVPVGTDVTAVPREAVASAAAPRTGKIHTQSKGRPTPARPRPAGDAAALALLARLPRLWRDCPPWVRRRLADTLGRALARYGPDAIVTAVARYAPDPATAALAGGLHTATVGTEAVRHVPALAAALALLAADVKGGACPACAGEHPGRQCGQAEPVDLAAAADPDRCVACDRPGGQVRPELPLPTPVCGPCWDTIAAAGTAA